MVPNRKHTSAETQGEVAGGDNFSTEISHKLRTKNSNAVRTHLGQAASVETK